MSRPFGRKDNPLTSRRLNTIPQTVFAARARVERKFPPAKTLLCIDCGQQAKEYDHPKGYEEDWDKVEPVCQKCHTKRGVSRGTFQHLRKHIGPVMKNNHFYSLQALYMRKSEKTKQRFLASQQRKING